jgi:ABC-type multidrug transport system permease subunit
MICNKKIRYYPLFLISTIIYICVIIPYSWKFTQEPDKQCTLKNNTSGHLQWNWNSLHYYYVVYSIYVLTTAILFFTGIPSQKIGIYMAFLAIITYIITGKIYSNGPNNFNTVGSMWCFFAAFLPIFYYGLRKTKSISL